MPDDLASTLAGIRDRAGVFAKVGPPRPSASANAAFASAADVPPLLAAIEAALKEADDWDAEARGIFLEAARTADAGEVGAASALQSSAADLREAITRKLTGKEAGDGTPPA
jgi:predicted RNA-binding Zn ribbon-like protein